MDPQEALAVFLLTTFAATAQSVTGFGFGLVVIPPLILLLGPRDTVALSTAMGTFLSALMLFRLYADVPWRPVSIAIVSAIAGTPAGLLILVSLDKDLLQITIAVAVLAATAVLAMGYRVPAAAGTTGTALAGFVAGLTRMAAGLPGPPMVLYFQATGFTPAAQRSAITAFFAITGIAGIVLFAGEGTLDLELAALALVGVPGIALGWLTGSHLFSRMEARIFTAIVYVMLVGSALVAIATAIPW